jgi:hypothetical protein
MNFNLQKCKQLRITRKKKPIHNIYHLGTEQLLLTDKEKDLGIMLHHKLTWHDHIITKVNTANKILRLIKRTCGNQTQSVVIRKLYIHLVRPHLEYACEIWSPHQAFLQDMIESVQRRATRLMIKGKSYTERLKSLHLLTLKSRRTLLDLTFFYKCLNGLLSIDLSRFINSRDTAAYDLRHADLSFKILYSRTNMLKYSYFHRTVKAWNCLPVHVRKSESLSEFKRLCKAYFYQLDTKLT